jgi:hypothetical protein
MTISLIAPMSSDQELPDELAALLRLARQPLLYLQPLDRAPKDDAALRVDGPQAVFQFIPLLTILWELGNTIPQVSSILVRPDFFSLRIGQGGIGNDIEYPMEQPPP